MKSLGKQLFLSEFHLFCENALVLASSLKTGRSVYLDEHSEGRKKRRSFILWKLPIPFFSCIFRSWILDLPISLVSWLFVLIDGWDCWPLKSGKKFQWHSHCEPFFRLEYFLMDVCIWKTDWFSTSHDY